MVVNNGIAHDARVLKSALTLARSGARVVVAGLASSGAHETATLSTATGGSAVFERRPAVPRRGPTPAYAWWALRRRAGRLAPAQDWRHALPVTAYYRKAVLPLLERVDADVIHVHDVHLLGAVSEFAGRRTSGPKVVYDAHEFVSGLAVSGARTQRAVDGWAALEAATIHRADRVITVADGLADRLQDRYALDRRPTVVHNAPIAWASEIRASRSLRAECGVGPDVPLAVYSGALSAARGVGTAVDALGLLPDVHLAVVAVPHPHPMAAELRRRAEAVGAGDRLHLPPPVPSHEVPAYLSEADVAVSPIVGDSVSYDLALPNKLFEYLHAGLPLVVSDCRSMQEFVSDHGLGASFTAGDAAGLAEALRRVLDDPPRPDTQALRAEFSWQGQESRLLGLYDELVDGLRVPSDPLRVEDLQLHWRRV
jgi:glycosyltransferase involved in cell wall biosynthesis